MTGVPLNNPLPANLLVEMVTPAVLISAAALLLLSTTQRLARSVDRARALAAQLADLAERPDPFARERRAEIEAQLELRARRSRLVQRAMTSLYVAVGLFVATTLAIGIDALVPWIPWLPGALGLAGAVALFVGCVQLIRETRLVVVAVEREMAFALRLSELKGARGGGPAPPSEAAPGP
ncbi:MAG: DUF2721 domain-containing protein [Thermoanaerobaculia bacterium]|nr:MAG: DUF2721 domain-containing protein [Thermoanaerobaculia bacterium]